MKEVRKLKELETQMDSGEDAGLEGGEGYCRGDSGHYVVRVKEVVRL